MLLTILSATCCISNKNNDAVLEQFKSNIILMPSDSICLDRYDILMPEAIAKYKDYYILWKYGSNAVDFLNVATGEVIHCLKKGRGPSEVINPASFQIYDKMLFIYDTGTLRHYAIDIEKTIEHHEQVISDVIDYDFDHRGQNGLYDRSIYVNIMEEL